LVIRKINEHYFEGFANFIVMIIRRNIIVSSGSAKFSLSNAYGEVVYHGQVTENGDIEVENVSPGIYTLWLMDGDLIESERIHIPDESL
jgi:hypothetical protein